MNKPAAIRATVYMVGALLMASAIFGLAWVMSKMPSEWLFGLTVVAAFAVGWTVIYFNEKGKP